MLGGITEYFRSRLCMSAAILLLSFTVCTPAFADGFQDGLTAAQRGDYAGAFKIWLPFAEAGDPASQFNIALLYSTGRGVPQDMILASWWYRMAADRNYSP